MSAFHDNALMGASGQQGYKISRSVRLRSSATAYFNRTPASTTNQKVMTFSAWVKRGTLSSSGLFPIFGNAAASPDYIGFYQDSFRISFSGGTYYYQTSAVYRDPSAWYHIVVSLDTTQATAANRVLLWINGIAVTSFTSSVIPQNGNTSWNLSGTASYIGQVSSNYLDGYITEINFIDGQALTPSSFGETDTTTGVWKPKKYAGTYGTNGFYLNFSDNSSNTATTIGKDYSGNGNNWTPNNISVTAGATYDSMVDSPTVGATSSNYAVLNPLAFNPTYISDGNLLFAGANLTSVRGSFQIPSTGMWYWELTPTTTMPNYVSIGLAEKSTTGSANFGSANTWGLYPTTTLYTWSGTSGTNTGISTPALGCTFALAFDASTGKLWLGYAASGAGSITWIGGGSPASGTSPTYTLSTTLELFPFVCSNNTTSDKSAINFGQRPFAYTPPTGFKALNTQNMPSVNINNGAQYMAATLYTGNGTSQNVVNSGGFQPNLVWYKNRSIIASHNLFDSVRGVSKYLISDSNAAEGTASGVTAFNANGFSVGSLSNGNGNGNAIVAWQWKESAAAGFDIVYQTLGTTGINTLTHNLGTAPKMIIAKCSNAVEQWLVYQASGTTQSQYLGLNTTSGVATSANLWGSSAFTSSQFYFNGTAGNTYVFYTFAPVAGYSAFGSYTGNGSADGPFVYCGFRPRFVMFKRTDAVSDWAMYDTSRNTYNESNLELNANLSGAEFSTTGTRPIDILSNGFKLRGTNGGGNASGGTYIFMAVAENPFKLSLAR